jgi:anti-sigma-K factor RskA
MTTSDIHSLSGAYALDAVDDLERAAFERHIRECDACALEVLELRETVARLADTAAVEPPESLRSSVLTAVSRTPQSRPARTARGQAGAVGRWRRFAAAAVAAGVLAAGVGVGTWVVAERNVDDARRVATAARERTAAIERVLAAGDVRVVSAPARDGGVVNVAISASQGAAVAVLGGLPELGAGRIYQLWMVPQSGAPDATSAGTMAVGQTTGSQLLSLGDAVAFGVSIEPEGGSARPTPDAIVGLVRLNP